MPDEWSVPEGYWEAHAPVEQKTITEITRRLDELTQEVKKLREEM